jgi:hypothetical protein
MTGRDEECDDRPTTNMDYQLSALQIGNEWNFKKKAEAWGI